MKSGSACTGKELIKIESIHGNKVYLNTAYVLKTDNMKLFLVLNHAFNLGKFGSIQLNDYY